MEKVQRRRRFSFSQSMADSSRSRRSITDASKANRGIRRRESVELKVMDERDYENCREKTLRNSVASLY